jgi:hypothetical protein
MRGPLRVAFLFVGVRENKDPMLRLFRLHRMSASSIASTKFMIAPDVARRPARSASQAERTGPPSDRRPKQSAKIEQSNAP